jgi:mitochondrial fission protein ELM1
MINAIVSSVFPRPGSSANIPPNAGAAHRVSSQRVSQQHADGPRTGKQPMGARVRAVLVGGDEVAAWIAHEVLEGLG